MRQVLGILWVLALAAAVGCATRSAATGQAATAHSGDRQKPKGAQEPPSDRYIDPTPSPGGGGM